MDTAIYCPACDKSTGATAEQMIVGKPLVCASCKTIWHVGGPKQYVMGSGGGSGWPLMPVDALDPIAKAKYLEEHGLNDTFSTILKECSARADLKTEIRSLTPEQVKIATDLIRLLKAGRRITTHALTCRSFWCDCAAHPGPQ